MGVLDHLSDICTVDGTSIKQERRIWQTVEVKVKMDCDGCERRVRNAICSMKGARTVDVNRKQSKVTVTGYVDQARVIERIRSIGKRAEPWPYVKYDLVSYPYAFQAYDKKAPSGFVRNVVQAQPNPNDPTEQYTHLFSDENPNACTIMMERECRF